MKMIEKAEELILWDEKLDPFWIKVPREVMDKAIASIGADKAVSVEALKAFFNSPNQKIIDALGLDWEEDSKQYKSVLMVVREALK